MSEVKLGRVAPIYKGVYDETTAYNALDIVYYNGRSYMAKQDTKGNVLPTGTDNDYWGLIADKGADGAEGKIGPIGPQGEPGKDGIVPDFGNTSDLLPNNSDTVVGKLNGEFTDHGLNVKWFGAVGDGSTDDSAAFQKAIDAAYANFSNLASKKPITGSFEVDVPSGVYKISNTLVLPPMVKLKVIGFVEFLYNGKSGTSCIWVKQKDDVSNYPNAIVHRQAYAKGHIIDGSSGGLLILRDGKRDCIGLTVGNKNKLSTEFPVSRYSMQGVTISGFDEAMHWSAVNHYIGNYYDFHLEDNNINLMVGDDDIALYNSGENSSFYSSVIASASTAAVYTKDGWDINFFGCSFDFNNICFKDSSNWGKLNLVGCHLESNNRILQKEELLYGFDYTLNLKQCRILFYGDKLFEGIGNVTIRDCNYICLAPQTIDSLAGDKIQLEESNNICQGGGNGHEVILRLTETQSKDGNMISSDVSAFGQVNQTNANPLSKTSYNGSPALLVSSSGTSFETKVNLGILENVQPFKHNLHAAIKYVCNHSSDDYDLALAISGTDKYTGLSRTIKVFYGVPATGKNVESIASHRVNDDISVLDTQGIRPFITISTKSGIDASDFKFYIENVRIRID